MTRKRKRSYNRRSAKQLALLEKLQKRYHFKRQLDSYLMGMAGKPEEQEQKAFYFCMMVEFATILGAYELDKHNNVLPLRDNIEDNFKEFFDELEDEDNLPIIIYPAIICATADYFDPTGQSMTNYRHMGYQPGTSDYHILVRSGQASGLVLEMKSQRGVARAHQKRTQQFLRSQGFVCHVCKGFALALEAWLNYLEQGGLL